MTIYKVTYRELDDWTGKYETWNSYYSTREKAESFVNEIGKGTIIEITVH